MISKKFCYSYLYIVNQKPNIMNEFEIFQNANLNFINNAIYLLCVIIMTALAFYLIRRTREFQKTWRRGYFKSSFKSFSKK